MEVKQGRTRGGVAYTVRGSGEPLLWISGYVVPAAAFDSLLDELSRTFTVVAVDHRGSGTSRTRAWPTTTGTMAADAVSVLNGLGIESAHVVGASLGGMVAQEVAIALPHRVRSLVLCSTTAGGPGAKSPPIRQLIAELQETGRRIPGEKFRLRPIGVLHQAAAASTHDATRRLHRIHAPTLILHGSSDHLVPVTNATWLASRIADSTLRVIRGGTHLLMLESPAARSAVRSWLEAHAHHQAGVPPTALERGCYIAAAPYRAFLGQTLPWRRIINVALQLVHGRSGTS